MAPSAAAGPDLAPPPRRADPANTEWQRDVEVILQRLNDLDG
jgi:hypothetical protein